MYRRLGSKGFDSVKGGGISIKGFRFELIISFRFEFGGEDLTNFKDRLRSLDVSSPKRLNNGFESLESLFCKGSFVDLVFGCMLNRFNNDGVWDSTGCAGNWG